jgi:hypothetical protein
MKFLPGIALAVSVFALAACVTTTGRPDLVISRLEVTPAETTAGTTIAILTAAKNAGAAASTSAAAVDVDLYADGSAGEPITNLTGWQQAQEGLEPGESVEDGTNVRAPESLAARTYSICASVDPDDAIAEADEDNNRSCVPFTIIAGAPRRADFVIESVMAKGQAEASTRVAVKIRNAGLEAAGPFRIMAFARAPRQPLLLIECPLTEGQLAAGSPASCDDLGRKTPLGAGESVVLEGYFAHVVANGASFVRTPLSPTDPQKLVKRTVDFMVDGCFPPIDGRPVYCAVDEIDELNNFREATLKTR